MQARKSKTNLATARNGRKQNQQHLPAIPEKRYFTIGEVANLCGVKPHVLRYWEQEFSQLTPAKRRGNRRYYQQRDILVVRRIRELLYLEGFTIEGARVQLAAPSSQTDTKKPLQTGDILNKLITDLEKILQELNMPI
jgi:DNA-binding transcriptional MerR regulator